MADVKARLEELAAALERAGNTSHLSAGDLPPLREANRWLTLEARWLASARVAGAPAFA
jgi:hypothetical protein